MPKLDGKIDLSEFFKYSRPKKKPCLIGFSKESLSDAEQTQLDAACLQDNGIITNAAIIQWLGARGHEVSLSAVTSHRRRTCTCHD